MINSSPPASWIDFYLNIGMVFLLVLALFILIMIFRKGSKEDRNSVVAKLNQPFSYIVESFLIVLSIGAFTLLGYNYDRFARELGTFVGLGTAVLLGIGLTYYRLKFKKVLVVLMVFILLIFNTPMHKWLEDYSAVKACDKQAIDFLNTVATSQIEVQHFVKLALHIYELYTSGNVTYKRIYDFTEYREADYIIYRNNHMTWGTEYRKEGDYVVVNVPTLKQLESLTEVAMFYSEDTIIVIYKNESW